MHVLKMFDLSGKVAVITGAGNGLGFQIAEAMAEAGADVVCADIDMKNNELAAARVMELGRKALSVKCDVTREAAVAALFQQADKTFGRVDIDPDGTGGRSQPNQRHRAVPRIRRFQLHDWFDAHH